MKRNVDRLKKVRDFSHFTEDKFLTEISDINWSEIISSPNTNTDKLFSRFYNMFNKVTSTHVPFTCLLKLSQNAELGMDYQVYKEIN